ncbi:Hypothetical protein SCF082_LOCUS10671 [Durusdinium trenchii]|uniref:PDZ domain-containing protein n=1 Tax=Durusdinium trenchii TaxID=1381693 RepID=A0ABP0J800_9DINO
MDSLRGLLGFCCSCNGPAPEPEIVPVQNVFKFNRSRTELAEDVVEPSMNLHGWTLRDGQKLVMLEIEKEPGSKVGLSLEATNDQQAVLITQLDSDSLVAEWNRERPLRAVKVGDAIVEVNKKRGTFQELLDLMKKEDKLELLVKCS